MERTPNAFDLLFFLVAWGLPFVLIIRSIWLREALKWRARRLGLHVHAQGRTLYLIGSWQGSDVEISETTQGEGKQQRTFLVVTRIRPASSATPSSLSARVNVPDLRRVENGWLEGSRAERLHHAELPLLLDALVHSARWPRPD